MYMLPHKEIPFKRMEDVKEDAPELDIFYEPGMKNYEYSDFDGNPIGMYIIYPNEKKTIISTRNYYIYKEQRNKGWALNCVLSLLNYSFHLYPKAEVVWWATHVGDRVMDRISAMLYEHTITETNNPNSFGFNDPPPSELHWVTPKHMKKVNKKYPKGFRRFKI